MQKLYAFILSLFLCVSCHMGQKPASTEAAKSETVTVAPENLTTLKFDVRGMTCTDCENSVTKGVTELAGIAEIKASFKDSCAIVKFDKTKTDALAIKTAIENRGYEVKGFTEARD